MPSLSHGSAEAAPPRHGGKTDFNGAVLLTFSGGIAHHSAMKLYASVFFLLLCSLNCHASPQTVRDAQGHSLTLAAAPHRIISLAPGTTEMLFALGLGKSIVGDTTYCDYPPAARNISKIGDVTVNYEKVVSLRPDLVVASDANTTAAARLRQLRVPVFAIAPTSYASVEQSLRSLGQLTGTLPRARLVVAGMEAARAYAARIAHRSPVKPRVLPAVGVTPLYVAGQGTFIGDLIAQAGGQNTVAAVSGYAPYSKELVLVHPPDFILADTASQAALEADPVLSRLPAVRSHRFISIDPNILNRPGPRLADALRQLARALHPGTL